MIDCGISTPATSLAMYSATFSDLIGPTPARIAILVQAQVHDALHELAEAVHIEDELRLDELGPGDDFLRHSHWPVFERRSKWILDCADEEVGRKLRDVLAILENPAVAHHARHADQVDGSMSWNGSCTVGDRPKWDGHRSGKVCG